MPEYFVENFPGWKASITFTGDIRARKIILPITRGDD
jgi:hypothetical protein